MEDYTDKFNNLMDKLEYVPDLEINTEDFEQLKNNCLISIAISLKRIADKLELSQKQPIVMSAEAYYEWEKMKQNFKS